MASSSDPVTTAIRDACRRAWQGFSFSSFRGREVTGTHLLRIRGYSTVEKVLPHGKSVESPKFRAGGHTWTLEYYPNGYKDAKDGCASVVLRHKGISFLGIGNKLLGNAAGATASYNVSILDREGKEVYSFFGCPNHYEEPGRGIWNNVITETAEERRQKLRLDEEDSIFVRCEVTVQKVDKESHIKMFLRELLELD